MNKILFSMIALAAFGAIGTLVYKANEQKAEANVSTAVVNESGKSCCCLTPSTEATTVVATKTEGCCGGCAGEKSCCTEEATTEIAAKSSCCSGHDTAAEFVSATSGETATATCPHCTADKAPCEGKCEAGCCPVAGADAAGETVSTETTSDDQ